MYLIDTSVWISYFRQQETSATRYFERILAQNAPYGLTGVIFQEILQGSASTYEFEQLTKFLSDQKFYAPQGTKTYEKAAKLYYDCRKQGITIRSTIDCLIAQVAIENGLMLVHQDQGYIRLSTISPELRLFDLPMPPLT